MSKTEKQNELFDKIIKGLDLSYQRLIQYKKQKNSVLVVMRDGKIVHIKPDEL
jgi:hypothetical protein